jgi:hypothetical protein
VHGGALELEDNHPGLRAWMIVAAPAIPAARAEAPSAPQGTVEPAQAAAHNLRIRSVS